MLTLGRLGMLTHAITPLFTLACDISGKEQVSGYVNTIVYRDFDL